MRSERPRWTANGTAHKMQITTGKRIENGGVDQAGMRREIVARDCEVSGVVRTRWRGRGAQANRASQLPGQHENGARSVLFGDLVNVDEVSRVRVQEGWSPERRPSAGWIRASRKLACIAMSGFPLGMRRPVGESIFEVSASCGKQDERSAAGTRGRAVKPGIGSAVAWSFRKPILKQLETFYSLQLNSFHTPRRL